MKIVEKMEARFCYRAHWDFSYVLNVAILEDFLIYPA
jgi:hypothetical protein